MISMGISFFLFGYIEYMVNTTRIVVYSIVLRFIQGAASSLIQMPCYSVAVNDFPES